MKLAQCSIGAVITMLTMHASALWAQDFGPQILMLHSQQTSLSQQLSTVKPTLYMPIEHQSYGVVVYGGINQTVLTDNDQTSHSFHYGVGIHQQISSQVYSQLVLQQGDMANGFSGQQAVNMNLGVRF